MFRFVLIAGSFLLVTACLSGLVIGSNGSSSNNDDSSLSHHRPVDHQLKLKETFSRHEKHILRPGDRLSLKCVACGVPLPTITWNLDAFPIPETHRIQYGDYVSINGDVVSYVNISVVSQEDGGVYRCEARNEAGSVFHSEEIFVTGPPFIKPIGNVTVLSGKSIAIRCPVTGYPITRISWLKGGRELPATERQSVFENGTLIISATNRELDEGVYVCRAVNEKGEQHSRNIHVQVLKKPNISPFRFPHMLTEGMSVITTCSILTGDAPIRVQWFKDGLPLDLTSLDIHRNEMGDLGSSLVFRSVGPAHAGNYTCLARNRAGEDSSTATMIVKVPPKWKVEPSDQSAVVGDRVTFDCAADGFPNPVIRWKISTDNTPSSQDSSVASGSELQQQQHTEFKPISSNYHIQALENGSLTMKEVTEKDRGAYLCEAGNGVGADLSVVVRLAVHVKAHFKSNFQMIRVVKGKVLKVPCLAYGKKPLHIKWSKDGMEIDSHSDPKYTITGRQTADGVTSELEAQSMERSDSGSFVCEARNAFGIGKLTSRVLVEEVPDPPFDLKAIEIGSKGLTVHWSHPHTGNLPISKYIVQWKKETESWSTSSFGSEIGSSSNQIFITDLKPLTVYSVRVLAVNSLGESDPSQTLSIKTEEEAPGTAPQSVRIEALSSKSVRVKWKAPKHIESFGSVTGYYIGYKVLGSDKPYTFKTMDESSISSGSSPGHNSHTKLEAVVAGLKKATIYTFSVQAFNSKGAGPSSPEVTGKTLDKDPPSPPKLTITAVAPTSVSLSWSLPPDSSPVNGYRLFLRSSSEEWKSHETLAAEAKITNSHVIHGLRCGSKYQVYIMAFNEIGNSDPSESLAFTTDGGAPVAPDKTSFLTMNSSYITLHMSAWKSSSCPINNFIVQYKQSGANEWILASNSVNPVLQTFIVSDLYSGTWYNLLIGAHSDAGSTEAEYLFATLTETGATVSPLSASSASADGSSGGGETAAAALRLKRYIQMFLPIISIFVAFVVILVLLMLLSVRRGVARRVPGLQHFNDMDGGVGGGCGKMDARSMSMSMSSVGKVVYESVHRGATTEVQQLQHQQSQQQHQQQHLQQQLADGIPNQRNNLLYCPSPYATTRVSLFFPGNTGAAACHQTSAMSSEQNCYDMPIMKPAHVNQVDEHGMCGEVFEHQLQHQQQQLLLADLEDSDSMDISHQERGFQR